MTADERAISLAIAEGIRRARDRIRARRLLDAIERNNLVDVQSSLDTDTLNTVFEPVGEIFARVTTGEINRQLQSLGMTMRFDVINPNVVRYAQDQAARLVTRLTSEQRKSVNQAIVDAVMGRFTVDETAKIIRASVGLTDRYTQAVATRYQNVRDSLKDAVTPAEAGKRASEQAARYADKLLRARGRAIARTEIQGAANAGKQIGWETAIENGYLSVGSKKIWILSADACPICQDIALEFNDTALMPTINQEFYHEDSGWHGLQPPVHPNCRCTTALVTPARAIIDELLFMNVA